MHRMPACKCPWCAAPLDAATDPSGEDVVPRPGDLTICLHCTNVLHFDAQLVPQRVDQATLDALEPGILRMLQQGVALARRFSARRADA